MLAGGLKVDGALTLLSLNSLMKQIGRTRLGGLAYISPALRGTPVSQGVGGSFVRTTTMDWVEETGNAFDVWGWVPGGEGHQNKQMGIKGSFLSPNQKEILTQAIKLASVALGNDDCKRLISGPVHKDARGLLSILEQAGQLYQGNLKKLIGIEAATATDGYGVYARITFDDYFFFKDPRVGERAVELRTTAEITRAIIILHELSHASGKFTHRGGQRKFNEKSIDQHSLDMLIYEICFK